MSYPYPIQHSRRKVLGTLCAAVAGTSLVLSTGGLAGLLAQEAKSKTMELAGSLENKDAFPQSHVGNFKSYGPNMHLVPEGVTPLPKLLDNQSYGLESSLIYAKFDLTNFRNIEIEYQPKDTTERLGVYDFPARFVRDTHISARITREKPYFILRLNELELMTLNNVQIPVTVSTLFKKNDLDDKPGPGPYQIRKDAGPSIPEPFRISYIPIDEATAAAKYIELIDLVLQEARNRVRQATFKK